MHKRTMAVLEAEDEEFIRLHADSTNGQLLAFVIKRHTQLRHVPHASEVAGAKLIISRFGTWQDALIAAHLTKQPKGDPALTKSRRYQEEYARQQELYRKQKKEKEERRHPPEIETGPPLGVEEGPLAVDEVQP